MDILAMHVLAPLSTSYLPWTISAMRPSALVAVLNEIALNGRRSIVELGAGISTWYIARLLRQVGGHLTTVEDDDWYDRGKIYEALDGRRIDLLIVDGPPAFSTDRAHARYPAVPVLAPLLAEDHAVVLDDIDRTGEQEIVDVWERDFGITFERRVMDGGIAISHSKAALNV